MCLMSTSALYTVYLEILDVREDAVAVFGPVHCQVICTVNHLFSAPVPSRPVPYLPCLFLVVLS